MMTKEKIAKILSGLALIAFAVVLVMPLVSSAADISAPDVFPSGFWGPLVNPLAPGATRDICGFVQTVVNVIYFAITILFFILIPVYIMYGGFLILTSMGSSEKVDEGKKAITGAIVGAAIALLSFTIIDLAVQWVGPQISSWKAISCTDIQKKLDIVNPASQSAK